MSTPIHTKVSVRILMYIAIVASFIGLSALVAVRPVERISRVQTSDGKHIHQVYSKNPLKTQFTATAQGLSGIRIESKNALQVPPIVQLYDDEGKEIPSSLHISSTAIQLVFDLQEHSKGKKFTVTIETPNLSKQDALLIPYESDDTKYPDNLVWQGNIEKQGSLGLTEYEKPTIALSTWRWMLGPRNRMAWPALLLILVTIPSLSFKRNGLLESQSKNWSRRWEIIRTNKLLIIASIVCIGVAIFFVYSPAINLSFYLDDGPIIARAKYYYEHNVLQSLLPQNFVGRAETVQFMFQFYRPVSLTLYPILSYALFGANASAFYGLNLLLYTGAAALLFLFSTLLLRSIPYALLATTLWAFHSTKIHIVYWWSSSQDILSMFFGLLTTILFFRARAYPTKGIWIATYVAFFAAAASKEYMVILPCMLVLVDFLIDQPLSHTKWQLPFLYIRRIAPLLFIAGIYVLLRTIMISQTVSILQYEDAYEMTVSANTIAKNIYVYSTWSAEHFLWPTSNSSVELFLQNAFQQFKITPPLYPGIFFLVLGMGIAIWGIWKKQERALIAIGIAWWLLFLGPLLLFKNDWQARWLSLAIFGAIIVLVAGIRLAVGKTAKVAPFLLLTALLITGYGYKVAREPELISRPVSHSHAAQEAIAALQKQSNVLQEDSVIYVRNASSELKSTIDEHLFRIYSPKPFGSVQYIDENPVELRSQDIMIYVDEFSPQS